MDSREYTELAGLSASEPPGTRPRRVRRSKDERRAEIASVTLRLMAERGLTAATNARIADQIGITEPGLYAHFENRADILFAAMDILVERILRWVNASSNPNMLERLQEMGESHAAFITNELEGFVLPTFEFIASHPKLGLSPRFGQKQLDIIQRIAEIVRQGQEQGTIREDIDPELPAWELMFFAWIEDIAQLAGHEQLITDGTCRRILYLILRDMAAPGQELVVQAAESSDL